MKKLTTAYLCNDCGCGQQSTVEETICVSCGSSNIRPAHACKVCGYVTDNPDYCSKSCKEDEEE